MEQTITLFDMSDIGGKGLLQLSNLMDFAKSGLTIKKVHSEIKELGYTQESSIAELSKYKLYAREDIPVDMGRKLNKWIAQRALFLNAKADVAELLLKLIISLIIDSEEVDVNRAFFTWRKHRRTYATLGSIARVQQHVSNHVKHAKKHYHNAYMEDHNDKSN